MSDSNGDNEFRDKGGYFQMLDTIKLHSDGSLTLYQIDKQSNDVKCNYSYGRWTLRGDQLILSDRVCFNGDKLPNARLVIFKLSKNKLTITYPEPKNELKKGMQKAVIREVFTRIKKGG